jgi:hypothetical protein
VKKIPVVAKAAQHQHADDESSSKNELLDDSVDEEDD